MRIIVISDTHKKYSNLETIISKENGADLFIHLGDGENEASPFIDELQDKFIFVSGNNDFASIYPSEGEIIAEGKRIFFTHGHHYQVKWGYDRIIARAKSNKADILLFGHTHEAFKDYRDGLYIMNPGSAGLYSQGAPSYGVIEITKAGIVLTIVRLKI